MSCVVCTCRRWRQIGIRHLQKRRSVEHALTTHVLRRQAWRQPFGEFSNRLAQKDWQLTGLPLTKWAVGLCTRLETLVMTFPVKDDDLLTVLASCPGLRHLVAGSITTDNIDGRRPGFFDLYEADLQPTFVFKLR